MFGRLEDTSYSLDILVDTARILSKSVTSTKKVEEFVTKCLKDYTIKQDRERLSASLVDPLHDIGIVGVLEYLDSSEGNMIQTILPQCYPKLENISNLVAVCVSAVEFSTAHLELFMKLLSSKILSLASNFAEYRQGLLDIFFAWTRDFVSHIRNDPESPAAAIAALLLTGIFKGVDTRTASVLKDSDQELESLMNSLYGPEGVIIALKVPNQSLQYSKYDKFHLVVASLTAFRDYCASKLFTHTPLQTSTFNELWEESIREPKDTDASATSTFESLNTLHQLCLSTDWQQLLGDLQSKVELQVVFREVLVMCAIQLPEVQQKTIAYFQQFLKAPPSFTEDINLDVTLVILEGLGILSINSMDAIENVIKSLQDFLVEPAPIFYVADDRTCAILRECASQTVAAVLHGGHNPSFNKSVLYSFINTIHVTYQKLGSGSSQLLLRRLANATTCVSGLCTVLKPKEVIEIAIPALARRLDGSNADHDELLWENLGNIGITLNDDIFSGIISFILNNSKKTFGKIAQVGQTLAKMPGRPWKHLEIYMEHAMALLLEKAAVLQQTGGSAVEELFEITNLIKVICQQDAFKSEFVKASSGELKQQFRNMWFYFVLYVMKSDGSWPKDWIPVLNAIAENTPTLVPDVSQRSLVADLGANSILRGSFPDSITQKIKNCILSRWPHAVQVNDPKVMPWSVQVFLFTIYKIESLRIRSNHKVDNLKEYLTDQRLQPPDIYMILELSVHEIFKQAVSDPRYKTHHISIHENHISALVYFGSQRIPKVRQFARKWVRHVLKSVPKLIWHQRSVFAAFDTIQLLERLADEKGVSNRHQPPYVFVSAQEAKEAYQDFLKIVEGWLDIGFSQSSNETLGVIQTYLVSDAATHSVNYGEVPGLMEILNHFTKGSTMTSSVIKSLSKYSKYLGEIQGMILMKEHEGIESTAARQMISKRVRDDLKKIYRQPEDPILSQELSDALLRCAAMIILSTKVESELLYLICAAPKQIYSANAMHAATNAWAWVMFNRPEYHSRMLVYMVQIWDDVAVAEQGIYSKTHQNMHPFATRMNYGTPNQVTQESFTCEPHSIWIEFLYERFKSDKMHDIDHVYLYMHLFLIAGRDGRSISTSWAALEARFDLALFGLRICSELIVWSQTSAVFVFREVLHLAFGWFAQAPMFGALTTREFEKIALFYKVLSDLKIDKVSLTPEQKLLFPGSPDGERVNVSEAQQVLLLLLESELHRFATWISPLQSIELEMPSIPQPVNERLVKWNQVVRVAWQIEPLLAVHLRSRFSNSMAIIDMELAEYTRDFEVLCSASPEALDLLMKSNWKKNDDQLRLLLYWTPVTPILAINLLGSQQTFQTWVLQYAIRSLKFFPTDQVFFYIPQIVQALRRDNAGYIEQFILDAAMTSQQFAHQIVWNMKANMFKDEATEEPDALKPVLDRIINKIINSLTGSDKKFYEREFKFFEAVTGISGKLKPLVQANATKAEKKKKIDQEMRLIQVDPGVYLPTNPDQYVVDIDYDSGRPLQSHAKAPFMATFEVKDIRSEHPVTKRMASMFKVGDDCRQDVLALQLISCFQNVFNSVGLDLYTFPYRVVATAPGCGVIEVIPNSISRDMMGREKVNSLYDWFIAQFGSPDSMEYHNARYEFVKSLAAYSVVLFLLQIKDRHNGNIMFDRDGHMIHIDFGFMLSIAPGGGILEVSPFKLTTEMVQVMGGDAGTHWYKLFSELLIKAYLATRKYAEELILMVQLMLDSGLPCFKGEVTIKKLRERFQLDKTDRQAAEFMIGCIRQSHENTRSGLYDRFQYLQNGIPF